MANPKICPCTPFPDCRVRILITNRDRITLPQKHENVNASKNSLARQAFRLIRSVSGIRFLSFFFHRNRYILIFSFFPPRIEPAWNYSYYYTNPCDSISIRAVSMLSIFEKRRCYLLLLFFPFAPSRF